MTPSAPSHSPVRRTMWAGAFSCAVAIVLTVVLQSALRSDLSAAYSYSRTQALDDAQSATLTYLFTIFGVGLVVYAVLAEWRVLGHRVFRWVAGVAFVLGTALAVYNATQPFPAGLRLVGLVPSIVGVVALVQLRSATSHSTIS